MGGPSTTPSMASPPTGASHFAFCCPVVNQMDFIGKRLPFLISIPVQTSFSLVSLRQMRQHLQKELLDTPEELGNLDISTNSFCPRGGVSDGTLASLSPTSDCLLPSSQAPAHYDFWTPNSLSQQNQRLTWFKAFTPRALHTYAKQYVWPTRTTKLD